MDSWKIAFLIGLGAQVPLASAQVKAFEGAEGFGAYATGARTNLSSASVYHVTNLNDSGAGSFRDAVSQSNRFIVFDVGGIVTLGDNPLTFASNLTIAGQTAPGGFAVYNNRAAFHGANNLISRHWAIRLGRGQGRDRDAAGIARGTNMIFDHMSIAWGTDGTFDLNPDSGQTINNITIQSTIIGQGLDVVGHSTGGLMTIGTGNRLSIIKSLLIDNATRNPKVRGENEFINNVVYGYEQGGYLMGDTGAVSNANAEGNYFIHGERQRYDHTGALITINPAAPFSSGSPTFSIYGRDNWVDGDRDGQLDGVPITSYPGSTVVATRHAFPTVASMTAQEAVQYAIDHVGASIVRDAVDQRMAEEVASYGTIGKVIVRETELFTGYGTDAKYLNPRARLVDSDNDGMPDNWEISRGLNPNLNSTAEWRALNADGRTRLEAYLNELGEDGETILSTGGNWSDAATTWSGAAPTLADSAIVVGNLSVTGGNAFARRVAVGGNLTITGGTLDVFDTAQVDGTLSLAGGTATLGRILLSSTGTNAALTLGGGSTVQTGPIANGGGTALLTFDGGTFKALGPADVSVATLVTANGGTINTNGYNGSLTGGLTGSGTLVKTGAGTLTLAGNNAGFTGGINLTQGTIAFAAAGGSASGTGVVTMSNGTSFVVTTSNTTTPMALASGATVTASPGGNTYGGAITGAANTKILLTTTTTGNFTLNGSLAGFNGTLDLGTSTGNVRIGGAGSAATQFNTGTSTATLRSNGGNVGLGSLAGGANTKLTGSVADNSNATYLVGGNNLSTTFAGTIGNGSGATPGLTNLTKTGTGTLTLSNAASTYTGVTTVSGGVLSAATLANGGANSSIGAASNAATNLVLDGGRLRYTGGAVTIDRQFTIGASGGGIEASGSGTLVLSSTAAVPTSGAGDRTFTLGGTNTGFNNFNAPLTDPAGGGKLSLTKDGPGTWRLFAASTYSGDTAVNAGTLYLVTNNALPSGAGKGNVTVNGTLDIYGTNQAINGLNGSGTVTTNLNTTRTLTLGHGDADGSFAGTLTQGATRTLALAKVGLGTQVLSGTSDYTGTTAVSAGTLIVNGALTGTGAVTVADGATLGGGGSIAGPVTVNAGGRLAPGNSPGKLSLLGGLTLGAGADLAVQLDGPLVTVGYDQLDVAGGVSLDGAKLLATLGYVPTTGQNFFILKNDGTDAIAGRLAGLDDGATLDLTSSVDGLTYAFKVSYFGDADLNLTTAGNDLVLTNLGLVPEPVTLGSFAALGTLAFVRRRRR